MDLCDLQMNSAQAVASKKHPSDVATIALTKDRKIQRQSSEPRRKLRIHQKRVCNQQDAKDCEVLHQKLSVYAPKLGIKLSSNCLDSLFNLDELDVRFVVGSSNSTNPTESAPTHNE